MLTKTNFDNLPVPLALDYGAQKLDRLQTELLSTVRKLAVQEVTAALTHKINEPLTALLLYLHEIVESRRDSADGTPVSDSIQNAMDSALRETERICNILREMGQTTHAHANVEIAAHERDETGSSTRCNNADVPSYESSASVSVQQLLTARELEVLALITGGASNKEGGCKLGISTRTFEVHRAHIMEKFGARNAADLVRRALSEPIL
jgi:DNA-binding CsgD family transcriptional regulator